MRRLVVLALQIVLGGWTSSNYAALACPDFPTCQASWWPDMDFKDAFVLWRGLGIDYEGGVLDHPARVAIHFTHRLGAVVAALVLGSLVLAGDPHGPVPRGAHRRRAASARCSSRSSSSAPLMVLDGLPAVARHRAQRRRGAAAARVVALARFASAAGARR